MGEFVDRLARLVIKVASPDGRINLELRQPDQVVVSFVPGAYRSYTAGRLARQLAQLATLTWTRYHRGYRETVEAILGPLTDDGYAHPRDREFWARLERLSLSSTSDHKTIHLRSRALVAWDISIADRVPATLTERQFLAELHSAAATILTDYRARVVLLTDEVYNLGLPNWRRVATTLPGRRL
jgi:hypothetical protein